MIARGLGDYRSLTATANSTAHGRFVDQLNVFPGADVFIGSYLVFRTGSNAGQVARVVGNNRGLGELQFVPNASALAALNDDADMVCLRGSGWVPEEYWNTINDVLKEAGSMSRFLTVLADYTFDADSPDLTINTTNYDGVEQIQYYDDDWGWQLVPAGLSQGDAGWWADPQSGKVYFYDGWDAILDAHSVRVTVFGQHAALSTESSTTTLDPEYIKVMAMYRMLEGGIRGDPTRYTLKEALKERVERMENVIRSRGSSSSQAIRLN